MYRSILIFTICIYIFAKFASANQVRGLWVVRYALTEKNEIENIILIAKSLNITDLYVQVRALGLTYGQKPISSKDAPLSLLIKIAKSENIRIHAWLNVLYIWAGSEKPLDKNHIYFKSYNSILRRTSDEDAPEYIHLKRNGIEGFFIDPSDQTNLLDIQMIISNLIENYGIEGIHLDYLRYPSLEYSFSPNGRTNYYRENWYDPIKIFNFYTESGIINYDQKYNSNITIYKSFLRDQLTDLLIKIKKYIQTFEKPIQLSAAVKPDKTIAYEYYFQDWGNWISNGICDHIIIMNYDTVLTNFSENLKFNFDNKIISKIVIGISTYNQNFQAVLDRIELVNNKKNAGYAIFSYNHLKENQSYLNNLKAILSNQK